MAYLKIYSSMSGYVGLSINTLVKRIGYKPDRHDGKINSIVTKTLIDLEKMGQIFILDNFDKINSNECFIIQINDESELFYPESDYVILSENEFNTIVNTSEKCDRQDLLNVFLNIKKYINMGKDFNKACYPSHKTLCRDCNISSTGTINKLTDVLVNIGLLYKYNSGKYIDSKGKVKFANSFYALEQDSLDQNACDELIKSYYSSQGIVIDNFIKQ